MTSAQLRLVWLILIELAVGVYVLFGRSPRYVAPVPDLSAAHPLVADHIRAAAPATQTPDEWAALGETYLAYGYFPEGEACYRVAAARSRDRADRSAEWAFALERIGDLAGANEAYERAVTLGHPDPGGCWYSIGRNHLRNEDVATTRAAFERAGSQPSARYELTRLAVRDGKPGVAIPVLDRLAAEHPAAVQPPLLRHKIEALTNSPLMAAFADRSTRATGRLPTPFDRDWKRLEDAYERIGPAREIKDLAELVERGRVVEAEPRLVALQRAEWGPSGADLLAEVAFRAGRPGDAIRQLREAIDRDGPSAHFYFRLGSAYAEAGNHAEAATAWQHATRLGVGGETKDAWHRLAEKHEREGNTTEANRSRARADLGAGHELFWAGKPADARPAFEQAVQFDPLLAGAWFYLGESERLLGRADAARAAYGRCLGIDPDFGRAHTGLALLPPR